MCTRAVPYVGEESYLFSTSWDGGIILLSNLYEDAVNEDVMPLFMVYCLVEIPYQLIELHNWSLFEPNLAV